MVYTDEQINRIIEIEKLCYDEKYVGDFESVKSRCNKCGDSLIFDFNKQGEIVGYICSLPVTDKCVEKILNKEIIYNVSTDEVTSWVKTDKAYIISVCVLKEYRTGDKGILLLDTALMKLKLRNIKEVYAIGCTKEGNRLLKNMSFKKII